jgi:hypothetical protein
MAADLAILAYRQEHGRPPPRLDDLAPDYLTHVPLDPFANEPLRYRLTADSYVLYSVGPNGRDDGGEIVDWLTLLDKQRGDFFLDMPDPDEEP